MGCGQGDVPQSEPRVRRGRGRPPGRGRRGGNVCQRDVNGSLDSQFQAEAAASKRLRTEDANDSDNNVEDLSGQLHQQEHFNAGSSVNDNGP